jgi:phosphomannomutase
VIIPVRARNLSDPADADCARMTEAVRKGGCHLGILIDDDAQTCAFFDEAGRLVSPRALTLILSELILSEMPGSGVGIEESAAAQLEPRVTALGGRSVTTPASLSFVPQTLRRHEAQFAGGDSGRYWFREAFPTCDALLTLARVLQALSRSDADFSEVVRGTSGDLGC